MACSQSTCIFTAFVVIALTAATIGTTITIANQFAYANHNIINRGECKQIFESQGSTKKEAQDLCSDPNIIIYTGHHCVSYLEQFGFSRDDAHDICQAFDTHKFNKSNP
jgi:hypothetical protein